MSFHPILDRRLLFVSGKGGVGKTVTAAAISLYAFRKRKRVLVVELSPYGRVRELLGGPELGPDPVEIQPRLDAVRIEPRRALEDFLVGILRFRTLTNRLLESHSFSILTAAAPGIEEFLVLSKIAGFEALRAGVRRRPAYDLIVVDAPATGHSLPLLSTARTVMEMMPVGPIGKMSEAVSRLLADPSRCAAVVVSLAEEMAVNETIEIYRGLARGGAIATAFVVVNAIWPERFTAEESRWLLGPAADVDDPLVALGRYHAQKRRRAQEQVDRLRGELGFDPIAFPLVHSSMDRFQLRRLVGALETAWPAEAEDGRDAR